MSVELLSVTPEQMQMAVEGLGMLAFGIAAFSVAQREWIRERRDGGKCQFPVDYTEEKYTSCGGEKKLEVHHIECQRWSYDHGKTEAEVDTPTNAITLCHRHHSIIHGDILIAEERYGKDKDSYKKVFQRREELVQNGEVYWLPIWDDVMKRIAKVRTERYLERTGDVFPNKR